MFLIRICCLLSGLLMMFVAKAHSNGIWQDMTYLAARIDAPLAADASQGRQLSSDFQALQRLLDNDTADIWVPLPNGEMVVYYLEWAPVVEQGLVDQYPEIRTFKGTHIDDPANHGVFTVSPMGFRAMIRHEGEVIYINPRYQGNTDFYFSYRNADALPLDHIPADGVLYDDLLEVRTRHRLGAKGASDGNIRTYRLAMAATGEYTAFHGGTIMGALAEIISSVSRVNMIFESELGISLQLVANNNLIVFDNPATDPYANSSTAAELSRNQTALDSTIGSSNYDIGHVVGTNGGLAYIGVACDNALKGQGYSGTPSPTGDSFFIDYLAHELGHQLGADHTFNGTSVSCTGVNRNPATAYEPGSGSTIMAYAGICGTENLQSNSDAYFHGGSIAEITAYTRTGDGASCGTVATDVVNNIPDADAGNDINIPAGTAFMLTGSATDDDVGNTLSYVWEQMDLGTASSSLSTMVDNGSRPIFRSFSPVNATDISGTTSNNLIRYLPRLSDVVGNTQTIGEYIPTTNRNLNFRLTVRDGAGATAFDNRVVTVTASAGPFLVTEPGISANWTDGATEFVNWNVANTNVAPVSCSQVDILLSTNGGTSFDTDVLLATPNDGSQLVTVPSGVSGAVRVMVKCSNDSFFAISGSDPSNGFAANSSGQSSGGSSGGGGDMGLPMMILFLLLAFYIRVMDSRERDLGVSLLLNRRIM